MTPLISEMSLLFQRQYMNISPTQNNTSSPLSHDSKSMPLQLRKMMCKSLPVIIF